MRSIRLGNNDNEVIPNLSHAFAGQAVGIKEVCHIFHIPNLIAFGSISTFHAITFCWNNKSSSLTDDS